MSYEGEKTWVNGEFFTVLQMFLLLEGKRAASNGRGTQGKNCTYCHGWSSGTGSASIIHREKTFGDVHSNLTSIRDTGELISFRWTRAYLL